MLLDCLRFVFVGIRHNGYKLFYIIVGEVNVFIEKDLRYFFKLYFFIIVG